MAGLMGCELFGAVETGGSVDAGYEATEIGMTTEILTEEFEFDCCCVQMVLVGHDATYC